MATAGNIWGGRTHDLDPMTMGELVRAYFARPGIQTYVVLTVICAGMAITFVTSTWPLLDAAVLAVMVYPPVWYLLHRFVRHGLYLRTSRRTATARNRIHFDHHRDPSDLRVPFGALYASLPTIAAVAVPGRHGLCSRGA